MSRQKIVLICADGAEPELVDGWGQEGRLPNLTALAARSATTRPAAPVGFGDGVAWPSLFTGTTPAKHGRYFRIQPLAFDYRLALFDDDRDLRRKPFWSQAGRYGYKPAVIDAPQAPLLDEADGVQVIDWLVHDPCKYPRSRPAAVIEDYKSRYGALPDGYARSKGNASGRSVGNIEEFTRQLLRQIDMKQRALAPFLDDDAWGLVVCGFQEAHDGGHELWHVHDPDHVNHDPDVARQTGDPILEIYAALDRAIGEIAAALGPDDFLFVVGGLGMQSCYTGNHLLGEILAQLHSGRDTVRLQKPRLLREAYRRLTTRAIRNRLKWLSVRTEHDLNVKSRRSSRFFALPHNLDSGAVRINLAGRETNGRVQPGREYSELCDELSSRLLGLVNVETGGPVVAEVIKTREAFAGDQLERLPDLLVIWQRDRPIRVVGGPGLREIRQLDPRPRTGDHSRRMFAMFSGPGIASSKIEAQTSVMDIGVSIATLLGAPIPDADGRLIPELSRANLAPR